MILWFSSVRTQWLALREASGVLSPTSKPAVPACKLTHRRVPWRGENPPAAEFKGGWNWLSRENDRNIYYSECRCQTWALLQMDPVPVHQQTTLSAWIPQWGWEDHGLGDEPSIRLLPGISLAGSSTHIYLHVPKPWPIFSEREQNWIYFTGHCQGQGCMSSFLSGLDSVADHSVTHHSGPRKSDQDHNTTSLPSFI